MLQRAFLTWLRNYHFRKARCNTPVIQALGVGETPMDLTQLANIGEFIGGLAVLITLVYLAIQLKQGTTALASNRHHEMLDLVLKNNFSPVSESREYAEFIATAPENPESLDEIVWLRFVYYAYGTYAMWEDAYVSHKRGLIDDEIWAAWDGGARSLSVNEGCRKFWAQEREAHSPLFREYIDKHVFPIE